MSITTHPRIGTPVVILDNRTLRAAFSPARDGLKLAQDVSPGNTSSNSASPVGTAETAGNGFSRPCGTNHLSLPNPGLASWAKFRRPCRD